MRLGETRSAITMATLAAVDSAHSDGGFKEVDAVNQPGLYRFDIPDAAFSTGADWVVVTAKISGAYVFHERFNISAGSNVADALLKRDMSAVSGESARSPINALRALRNKVTNTGGTLTVFKEDDTTSAWTAADNSDIEIDPS